jgi:hypothetical protein
MRLDKSSGNDGFSRFRNSFDASSELDSDLWDRYSDDRWRFREHNLRGSRAGPD